MKTYKVITYDRMDVTDKHYRVEGGRTKEEIKKLFALTEEQFEEALEIGYLGKDGLFEYEIKED